MSDKQPNPLIPASAIASLPQQTFSHPFNPNSEIHSVSLSEQVGMQRLGFHLVHIPPGKESFIYHSHQFEEEFIYIVSGRGIAEIDEREFEVGAGDFMGFPTPSVAHHLKNPFDRELVYLMGGERREMEIVDIPHLKKRVFIKRVKGKKEVQIADWNNLKPLWK